MSHHLTFLTFSPLLFGLALLALNKYVGKFAWSIGLASSIVSLLGSLWLWSKFDSEFVGTQFATRELWIPQLGSYFAMGADGISLTLALMVSLVVFLVFLGGRQYINLNDGRMSFFVSLMLFLQVGAYGTFLAQDLILFYFFWELILIPSTLLIGIFGGEGRSRAAIQFFVFTVAGSLFMLFGIAYLIFQHKIQTGVPTSLFSEIGLLRLDFDSSSPWAGLTSPQGVCFLAFAVAFFVKSPLFLFHGWMPKAYNETPLVALALIGAILSKMGTYGVIRFFGFFPDAFRLCHQALLWIALFGMLFGAFQAIQSKNLKMLMAWASLSHINYILLGLFSGLEAAKAGAVIQMFNHGILTAGIFLMLGAMLARSGSLDIDAFGGWAKRFPVMAVFLMILTLSSVGLPTTAGFVGEFLIMAGTYKANTYIGAISLVGTVLGALYMLIVFQKVMFGKASEQSSLQSSSTYSDLSSFEKLAMIGVSFFIFFVGLYPQHLMKKIKTSNSIHSDWQE